MLVVATDFSDAAGAAEAEARRLARRLGAELLFLHVATEAPLFGEGPFGMADVRAVYEGQRKWAAAELEARAAAARDAGVPARVLLRAGVPFEEIVRAAAEEKAEIVVIGTHGRTGLDRLLLGSVAERVVRTAPCPVLTVRPGGG
jgi:nucleotide-binding universal stress UspA family protein